MAEFKQLAEAQGLLNGAYRGFSYPTRQNISSLKLSTK